MGFFRQLTDLLRNQPLHLRMGPVQEGIRVSLWKGKNLVSQADLDSQGFLRRLPPVLVHFIKDRSPQSQGTFLVSYPEAKQLRQSLQLSASNNLNLECQPLDTLQAGLPPSNFDIRWIYNKPQKALERQLIGAERHLGRGWFQQGQIVWGPTSPLPDNVARFLTRTKVTGQGIATLILVIIPTLRKLGLACSCTLTIRTDAKATLRIVKMLDRAIDLQMTTNIPELLPDLEPVVHDSADSVFISGSTLLIGLRPLANSKLLQLARSGEVQRIPGTEMLELINDGIRPNADILGIDIATIDARYSIVDASRLASSWQVEKRRVQGIGGYWIKRLLMSQNQQFSLQTLVAKAKNGDRFYRTENGWLEFTPTFKKFAAEAASKNINDFQLQLREVLGTQVGSFSAQLAIPAFQRADDDTEVESAQKFVEALRDIGLPGVLSGLEIRSATILAQTCANLLRDNPKAKILWIVPKRKYESVISALKPGRVPNTRVTNNAIVKPSGQVIIATPDQRLSLSIEWTFVIFHDLDTFLFSDDYVRYSCQIKRLWALAVCSRPDALQVGPGAQKTMLILRLMPEDLGAFRQKCMQNFASESGNILSRLTSPFKKVLSENNVDPSSIPIPPRSTSVVTPKLEIVRPQVTVTQGTPSQTSFVIQAKHFEHRVELSAEFQPFKQYWPIYSAMNPAQQQWYFYWRNQLRKGNFLNTDLSYIFVHIYEIINLIGFSTPEAAWAHIVTVWKHYRMLYPQLDGYLVDWLADFVVVYKLSKSALNWYRTALEANAPVSDFDLALEAWMISQGDFSKMPSVLLYSLSNYSPKGNKFYQEYDATLQIESAYKKGLQAVDTHLRKTNVGGLLDRYKSETSRYIARVPFGNALYEGNRDMVRIAEVFTRTSPKLSTDLSAVMKYTENILRKQVNFRSKLRGIEIPDGWATILDQVFTIEAPRREIAINMDSVVALQHESEEVRQRLTVENIDEIAPVEETPQKPSVAAMSTYTIRPDNTPAGLLTDLIPVATIMGKSDGVTAKLLGTLQKNGWEAQSSFLQSTIGEGYFLNVELDKINGLAYDFIGDSLILEENGKLVVAEDYRDEIEYILNHPDYKSEAVVPAITGTHEKDYSVLGSELAAFAKRLKPQHWEALAAIIAVTDVNVRLEAVARSAFTTADLLVEDINTFALEALGDIVIDTNGESPVVEDEDVEGLNRLIAWASDKALLEN